VQKRRAEERDLELSEGKQLVERDMQDVDLEQQMKAFKK
jgi:hypothetical protein